MAADAKQKKINCAELFANACNELGGDTHRMAKLMFGDQSMQSTVYKKMLPIDNPHHRGTNRPEAILAQLFVFLNNEGYDLDKMEVDELCTITSYPSKAN